MDCDTTRAGTDVTASTSDNFLILLRAAGSLPARLTRILASSLRAAGSSRTPNVPDGDQNSGNRQDMQPHTDANRRQFTAAGGTPATMIAGSG
jgi:hypothetical protein